MRVISKKRLREFWTANPDAEEPLLSWYREAEKADWSQPSHVKDQYRNCSFVGGRVIFNIKGNDYRLVVNINYQYRIIYIRKVCSHEEYDALDVKKV